jgi:esterase
MLAFTDVGDGEPLVVLHGLFGSSRNWASFARSLSGRYRILAIDLPNHGMSEWSDAVSYEMQAEAVANFLIRHELQGATLLGHSMGGKVAMALALKQPGLVGHLIVVDIAPVNYNHYNLAIIDALSAVDLKNSKTREEAENQLAKNISDQRICKFLVQNLVRNGDFFKWRINLIGLKSGMSKLQKFPTIAANKYFNGPTLFMAGSESDYIQPDHHSKIKDLFPNSSIVTIMNSGHWVYADNPKDFTLSVTKFLST